MRINDVDARLKVSQSTVVNIAITIARDAANRAGRGILPELPTAAPNIATTANIPRRAGVRVFAIIISEPTVAFDVRVEIAGIARADIDQCIMSHAGIVHFRC